MPTITAIIRAKAGDEATMKAALLDVAAHVEAHEPDTLRFCVSQGSSDRRIFTTYERFADEAAMARHNASAVVAKFFSIAGPLLDGEVVLVVGEEISAKS